MHDAEIHTLMAAAVEGCRFEFDGPVISVFGPGPGRVARIAAGRAVFRLRVAAAGLGMASRYGVALKPDRPDLLARVVVERTGQVDPVLAQSSPGSDRSAGGGPGGGRAADLARGRSDGRGVAHRGRYGCRAVAAGLALERVMVAATAYGLSPTFCDQPPDGLLDAGRPQVMIRLAYQTVQSAPVPWTCSTSTSTVGSAV